MVRKCQNCGRRLRTGIKWCSECKKSPGGRNKEVKVNSDADMMRGLIIFLFSLLIIFPLLILVFRGPQAFSSGLGSFLFKNFLGGIAIILIISYLIKRYEGWRRVNKSH